MIRVVLLAVLVGQVTSLVLDHNSFFLYNKQYHKARLTQFRASDTWIGTYEGGLHIDQLWKFDPHPTKHGCYYIVNEQHGWRLADAQGRRKLIVYGGNHYDDQLFKVVSAGGGYYKIVSCIWTNHKLAKYSSNQWDIGFYDGGDWPDQFWKFVPRHKASVSTETIFHFDNRQGSQPITRTVEVTKGLVRTSTKSVRNLQSFTQSLEASVEYMGVSATASTEFHQEIETTVTTSTETSWSETESIQFVVPAGKNYKVMQHVVKFDAPLGDDKATLKTKTKIFESTTNTFSDPDGFIINKQ